MAVGLVAVLVTAGATHADWLVTRDGGRVETKGEWRVEGRRVLFTLPNGTLSAMRLSEVDLEASRAATEEVKRPPKEPVEAADDPRPEPVLVLTNKDIPQAAGSTETDGTDTSTGGPELRVVDWSAEQDAGGVLVVGRLENGTDRVHSGIGLRVELRNDDGEVLATAAATVTRQTLVAGGISPFEARFPGYSELPGQPAFVIDSLELRQERDEEPGETGGRDS